MNAPCCRLLLPLTDLADQRSYVRSAFLRGAVALKRRHRSSARNQRKLDGSRPAIFPKGHYRPVRKRQPVSLTLSDHLLDLACQELIDLPGIIDLTAAFKKLPGDLLGL